MPPLVEEDDGKNLINDPNQLALKSMPKNQPLKPIFLDRNDLFDDSEGGSSTSEGSTGEKALAKTDSLKIPT